MRSSKLLAALLLGLACLVAPAHAATSLPLTGAGASPGGGVAPPVYNPLGVLLQPDVFIGTNSALNTTNTKTFIQSFWINGSENNSTYTSVLNAGPVAGYATSKCETTIGTSPGECLSFDASGFKAQFSFNNAVGIATSDAIKFTGDGVQADVFPQSQWNHYVITGDAASGHYAIALNGVNVYGTKFVSALLSNVVSDFSGGGFRLLNGMTNPKVDGWGYMSDVYLNTQASAACTGVGAPATMFGTAVTCAAADTIPPEILARFYSSGPVDPGTNCTTITGAQPEICLKAGTSGTTGMSTNLGTATPGVAIAPVAVYTGGTVLPAPYGPRGIPAHQATLRWMQANQFATVTSNAMTTDAGGSPIAVGDLIVIVSETGNNSTVPTGATCPSGGANTWHTVGPRDDATEDVQSIMCWTIAQTGDVSGAWTLQSTLAGTRTHGWAMADYANVASVDQSGSIYNGPGLTTTHNTASGLTTTSANETVISAWVHWEANTPNTTFNFPAGVNGRYRVWKTGNFAQIMWGDEYAVASGSNPQRTVTTAGGDTSAGFTLTLVPN